jgi:hypothetical protein
MNREWTRSIGPLWQNMYGEQRHAAPSARFAIRQQRLLNSPDLTHNNWSCKQTWDRKIAVSAITFLIGVDSYNRTGTIASC